MYGLGVLGWIVIGGFAGWLASIIAGASERMGCITNIVVGIAGGLLGGYLFQRFGEPGITGFNWWSFLVALVGALVLLIGLRLLAWLLRGGR